MIIKGLFGHLIHDDLRKVWEYHTALKWIIYEMSMDLNTPTFVEVSSIKIISFWQSWLLYFLPTQQFESEGTVITFKRWRGHIYVVDLKLK